MGKPEQVLVPGLRQVYPAAQHTVPQILGPAGQQTGVSVSQSDKHESVASQQRGLTGPTTLQTLAGGQHTFSSSAGGIMV